MGLLRPTTQPSLALIHPTCRSAGGGGGERCRAFFSQIDHLTHRFLKVPVY